jgi:hypothetical protein
MDDRWSLSKYYAQKKILKLAGGEIKIFDEGRSRLLFFVQQKAFKLKEDITVFADESKSTELLKIKARSIGDFRAAYDVTDPSSGEKLGALRRLGMTSLVIDTWEMLDASDKVIGRVVEDSWIKAMIRRYAINLLPQSFNIYLGESIVGVLKQTFNPLAPQYQVDFSMDAGNKLDRRIGIAAVILLQIIEAGQD